MMDFRSFKDQVVTKGPYLKTTLTLMSNAFWIASFLNYFFSKDQPQCLKVSCYSLPPSVVTAIFMGIGGAFCQSKINALDTESGALSRPLLSEQDEISRISWKNRVLLAGFFLNETLSVATGPTFTIKLIEKKTLSEQNVILTYLLALITGGLCSIANTMTAHAALTNQSKRENAPRESTVITYLKKAGPVIGEGVSAISDAYWIASFSDLLLGLCYTQDNAITGLSWPALILGGCASLMSTLGGAFGQNTINQNVANRLERYNQPIISINNETNSDSHVLTIEPERTDGLLTRNQKAILLFYYLNEVLESANGPTSVVRLTTEDRIDTSWLILTNVLSILAGMLCSIANAATLYRSFISTAASTRSDDISESNRQTPGVQPA